MCDGIHYHNYSVRLVLVISLELSALMLCLGFSYCSQVDWAQLEKVLSQTSNVPVRIRQYFQ